MPPKSPLTPSTINTRQKALISAAKIFVNLSPLLPFATIILFFLIPLTMSEKFYVDEHAFPIRGLQHSFGEKVSRLAQLSENRRNLINGNNNGNTVKSPISFKPLHNTCFDYAIKKHEGASSFTTFDVEPVVIAFVGGTKIDRWLASELVNERLFRMTGIDLAPSIGAPIVVLVANEENSNSDDNNNNHNNIACLADTFGSNSKTENAFFKQLANISGGGAGNIRLFTIIDTVTASKKKEEKTNNIEDDFPLSDFCVDARAGEARMPNLDAFVMHARIGTGASLSNHHFFISSAKQLGSTLEERLINRGNTPALYPACFSYEITDAKTTHSLVDDLHGSVKLLNQFVVDNFIPSSFKYYLNDLLSTISLLRKNKQEQQQQQDVDSIISIAKTKIQQRTNAPTIRLQSTFTADEISLAEEQPLRFRFRNFLDGLFLQTYSFTFLHERLHHSQLGYLLTSPDEFISGNNLQLIVFAIIICLTFSQIMFRGLRVYHSTFVSAGSNSSNSTSLVVQYTLAVVLLYLSFKVPYHFSDKKATRVTLYHPISGAAIAQLLKLLSLSGIFAEDEQDCIVSNLYKFIASILGGTCFVFCLTFSFPLAVAMSFPFALAQSLSFSAADFREIAFSYGQNNKNNINRRGVTTILLIVAKFAIVCATVVSSLILLSPVLNVDLNEDFASSYLLGPAVVFSSATLFW